MRDAIKIASRGGQVLHSQHMTLTRVLAELKICSASATIGYKGVLGAFGPLNPIILASMTLKKGAKTP